MRTHQFDVALYVQHQVLGLQVSVHDVLLMEVGVGLHHAGRAEHRDGLVKTPPKITDTEDSPTTSSPARFNVLSN